MKKVFFLSLSLLASLAVKAGSEIVESDADSLRLEQLKDVVINGVRALSNEAVVVSEIDREELSMFSKTGRELPFLFSGTPGITSWSENGLGIGTTYMRIRGAAGSRVNITLDGVPLNSPEDQCVFWANMNSYAAFLGNAQIQRGLGTSTNGDGAFGGTIALSGNTPDSEPSLEVTASYGSYNTLHYGALFSTGMILNSLIIDGAYNQTKTDGFIHGTQGNSGSYYGGLLWMPSDNIMLRYRNIGNFEMTGQAWSGITAGNDALSLMDGMYGGITGIRTYQDMYYYGLGQYNSLYEGLYYGKYGFKQDADGNYVTARYRMKDGSYWERTTDNFWQDHNILSLSWSINDNITTSLTAHYTYGYGYYNEFRPDNKLKKFGLTDFITSQNDTIGKSDFVRRKGLEQHTYGAIWNTSYTNGNLNLRTGLSFQQFKGNHFGHITYVGNDELESSLLKDGRYTYYDSDASKTDLSAYVKAVYDITPSLSASADVQYRHVSYVTDGINDKFLKNADGTYRNQTLDIDKKYDFINPKLGLNWQKNGHRVYGMVAYGSREPERNNFTDNGKYPAPTPESMLDMEAGYSYTGQFWYAGINLYRMDYDDQFVQTGEQSDIGENLTVNIKDSCRQGLELEAGFSPFRWLSIEGNAALSQNRIKDFTEVVEDWDNGWATIHYDNSTLAFSPDVILNGFINLNLGRFNAVWHTNYVSRQYLDNSENKERSLPAYSFSDLSATYSLPANGIFKSIEIGANLNNIFNTRRATSGWVYSAICESAGHTNDNRYYQIGFIPMAGFTAMGNITLKF